MVDWPLACAAQANRPLWQLQQANYGGCLFAVSALLAGVPSLRRMVAVMLLPVRWPTRHRLQSVGFFAWGP